MPDGKCCKFPLTSSRQLVVTVETKDGSSTSRSTGTLPVARKNGWLVIPLPVPTSQATVQ